MNAQTASQVIEGASTVVSGLLKEVITRRQEAKIRQADLEHQKEIAQLRMEKANDSTATTESASAPESSDATSPASKLDRATDLIREYEDLLAEAEQQEECDFCRSLLREARKRPLAEQRELMPELRAFLDSVKDGASREEMMARIQENDRLSGLIEDVMGVNPSDEGMDRSRSRSPTYAEETDQEPEDGQYRIL
jgi:hypothetical protein